MAYARGVHDAYRVLAPILWPTILDAPRSTASVDLTYLSQDQRLLPTNELTSLYSEFVDLIQTPMSGTRDSTA